MDTDNDRLSVYEIGYLIVPSVPEEKVPAEADAVRALISGAGAAIIAEEAPRHQRLAYTMRRKTLTGSYDSYDDAYFGWIKFEVSSDKIEALNKSVELHPSVLRSLLTGTVRENTYLGKRASAVAASIAGGPRKPVVEAAVEEKEKKLVTPASIEEMDKSIDEMVKEA